MAYVSSDKSKLDITFIHNFLTEIYWSRGRGIEEVKITIKNSLCFGIYIEDEQIGFARVVTDYVFFAYLMDVFIAAEHRNKGYSSVLMRYIMEYQPLKNIKIWRLATSEAHFLYKKFGFSELAHPENAMEKVK